MEYSETFDTFENQAQSLAGLTTDFLRRTSATYICWLLFGLALSALVYYILPTTSMTSIRMAILVYYIFFAIHLFVRYRNCGSSFLMTPDVLFLLLYTMFHLGYMTFYSLGLLPYVEQILYYESSTPRALLIVNIGMISFLFGYELLGIKDRSQMAGPLIVAPTQGWCIFGMSIMVFALVVHTITLLMIGPGILTRYGHTAIVYIERYVPTWLALVFRKSGFFMLFGVMIYAIGSSLRYRKLFHSKTALIILITFLTMQMLEVARTGMFQIVLPLMLIRHYLIKPFKMRSIALMFFIIVAMFTLMRAAKSFVFSPQKMMEEAKYLQKSGEMTWMSPFVEAGGSFKVVNITAFDIPKTEPYWKGASWRDAIYHIPPFLQGYLVRRNLSREAPAAWITVKYYGREAAGLGFSLPTEGYLNFGFFGVFLELAFIGVFIRWLGIKLDKNPSAMWAFIFFGCYGTAAMIIRNHISLATQIWVMIFLIGWLMNSMFGNEPAEISSEETAEEPA
jgi:hypothetical protein